MLVGDRRPPSPQYIDAAASDAQAAVGVCCIYRQGEADGGAVPPLEGARQYHRPLAGDEQVRFEPGAYKREECPGHPPDAPASVPSCWSITTLPARAIHHK